MLRFVTRRLVFIILFLIFIIFAAHLGMRMIRNSEAREPNFSMIPQIKLAWMDTRTYIGKALRGELGSARTDYGLVPVEEILKESYINSMGLLLTALAIAAVVGLYVGTSAALSKDKRAALPLLLLTILGIATPSFFLALLLRQGAIYYTRTVGSRLVNIAGFGWDFDHMLLPVLVLLARPLAYLTRSSFISVGRVMEEDYIRTAHSKGLRMMDVVNVHALRNVAVPVLTAVGVSLRFSLGVLPIVEFFFVWPGMGLRMLEAIQMRQTVTVVTLAAALGFTFLAINLLLDVLYRVVDPRLREISGG